MFAHGFPVVFAGILFFAVAVLPVGEGSVLAPPPAEGGAAPPPAEGGAVFFVRYFSGIDDQDTPGIAKGDARATDS